METTDNQTVTILGTRGSVPICGPDYVKYGGATTCVLVRLAGTVIALDAGTGLLKLPADVLALPTLNLLLTHVHLDHVLGLPMSPYVMTRGKRVELYAAQRGGMTVYEALKRVYSPPAWPITPDCFAAELALHPVAPEFTVGGVTVRSMEGVHPGGVTLFRLSAGGKSVVFMTDCTITPATRPQLLEFAADCDLLLCDGQYSADEWAGREDFGHSRWIAALHLAADCGAKMLRIVHHDPTHTDAFLDAVAGNIQDHDGAYGFAREGEVITL